MKNVGRPKSNFNNIIKVAVTDKTKCRLSHCAKLYNCTVSELLRNYIEKGLLESESKIKTKVVEYIENKEEE